MRSTAARIASLLIVVGVSSACYESSVPLSSPTSGLDSKLLGLWRCVPGDKTSADSAKLRIVAFDEHQYFADWTDDDRANDDQVTRYRAYASVIGSTTLLNVQELKDTTAARGRWMFLRYVLPSADRLTLSVAQDDLVKGANDAARLDAVRKGASGPEIFGRAVALCTRQR
jgi:hypothetical protein